VTNVLLGLAPLILFLAVWSVAVRADPQRQFLLSTPTAVLRAFAQLARSGELGRHTAVTAFEALIGFAIGSGLGAIGGLCLWYSPRIAAVIQPYIVVLGAIPIFALAPVMILWFGIGIPSKVAIATLSTIFVALVQAYTGARSVEDRHIRLMRVLGASQRETFLKVVVPSSLVWVASSLRINIGLALLGAFIGEFISAERGLGFLIIRASGVFDMATVFAGCFVLAILALALTGLVGATEQRLLKWRV
jgi:NitT/TauT family transport system permease protein